VSAAVRDLDTARELQGQVKAKRDWSGVIDEQIRLKLVGSAVVHANDLDGLGVPPEHRNLIGTRMARYANKGWMEATTERRKVEHPAANGRKNPVYRITRKGWQDLTAGLGAPGKHPRDASSQGPECVQPGEPQRRPTDAPPPKGADRSVNKPEPVPSVGKDAGAGSGVTSHALEPAPRLFEDSPPSQYDPWKDAA